jgi:CHAT domain
VDGGEDVTNKIKILFLAANPVDAKSRLRLDEEFRQIRKKLRGGDQRDCFELISEWAVSAEDLQEILMHHKPHILHFSGHGSATQGIVLEDQSGKMRLLDKQAFANLLRVLKDNLRMVVLNACYSEDQANYLKEIVDFTIGMGKAVGDKAAIFFASHFYQGLAFGRSVETAFELGKGQLDLSKIPESDTPSLLVRYGLTATEVILPQADSQTGSKVIKDSDVRPGSNNIHNIGTKVGVEIVEAGVVNLPQSTFTFSDSD